MCSAIYRAIEHQIAFVPKPKSTLNRPWEIFGSSEGEYYRWIPHICGICCLKMVGDTLNLTSSQSLYELTLGCLELGGFVIDNNSIKGVFHYPLVHLALNNGVAAEVEGSLDQDKILAVLQENKLAMLSISLSKIDSALKGSHLVLIHGYEPKNKLFTIHDCSALMSASGKDVKVPIEQLAFLSNSKGVVFDMKNT